jgi:hypothetical protein
MKLEEHLVEIGSIKLDIRNPRFLGNFETEEEILKEIRSTQDYKTLLQGMKENLRWVNRIVVQEDNSQEGAYIVVEGNTRMACLKSGLIPGHSSSTSIPVLVAKQEEYETDEEFTEEIRITQGIANVAVVKQWSPAAKARHLFNLFWNIMDNESEISPASVIKQIADTLGMSANEVRNSVKRYAFFAQIEKESDTLKENEWSYLEGLTKNENTRKFLGFNEDTYKFVWDEQDDPTEENEVLKERLDNIPKLIRMYSITTQQFRDKFSKLVTDNDAANKFDQLIEGDISWSDLEQDPASSKEHWLSRLNSSFNSVSEFPTFAEWAEDDTEIIAILSKIEKISKKQRVSISNGE